MYNGIGLATPRGSGTNGYVQRNFALVRGRKEKVDYKTEEDIKRLDAATNKKPNQEILDHERKRKLELKCMELEDLMEEQGGYSKDEIELKVTEFRRMLMDKDDTTEKYIVKDEFGRPIVRETHQIAEANQEKNQRLREAFGISEHFVEGSSLDPNRREKEKAAAQASLGAQNNAAKEPKSYPILRDSSSSPKPEMVKKKKKKKQAANVRERSESPELKKVKKKKSKKHKRERSESASPPAKKKKKTREHKHKHKKSHSPSRKDKKKKKYRSSSESDDEDSSNSDSDDSRSQKKEESQARKQTHASRTRERDGETYHSNVRKRFDSSDQKVRNSNPTPPSRSGNGAPVHSESKMAKQVPASAVKAKIGEPEKRRSSKSPESAHKQRYKERMKSVIEKQQIVEQIVSSSSDASSDSESSSESSLPSSRDSSPHEQLSKRNKMEEAEKSASPPKSKFHVTQQESARKVNTGIKESREMERKSSPQQSATNNGCSKSSPEIPFTRRAVNRSRSRSASPERKKRVPSASPERKKRVPSASPPRAYGGKARSRSRSRTRSHSASRSPTPISKSGSESKSRSRSRSRSQSWQRDRKRNHSSSRSLSYSPENRRRSRSRSRSLSRNRSRSNRSSTRSRSQSYSDSRSRSPSTGRRSPSIPRRRGSPSFLDKRRITSARKRPVPYHRPTPPTPSSLSSWSYRSRSTSYDRSLSRSQSRSRSRSWSRPRSDDSLHR